MHGIPGHRCVLLAVLMSLSGAAACDVLPRSADNTLLVTAIFSSSNSANRAAVVNGVVLGVAGSTMDNPCAQLMAGTVDPFETDMSLEGDRSFEPTEDTGTPLAVSFRYNLVSGTKLIYVEARDADGDRYARGCVTETVTGGESVEVTLLDAVDIPPPTVSFTVDPPAGEAPHFVTFRAVPMGVVTSYTWDFGDGTTGTGSVVTHTYVAEGLYTVRLDVLGPGGSASAEQVDAVQVGGKPLAPTASFVVTPTAGNAPLGVMFTSTSSGPIDSYLWNFGDGVTSDQANVGHTYTVPGLYTVSLTVSGPGGSDQHMEVDLVSVGAPPAPPVAQFVAGSVSGPAPFTVCFFDQSLGDVTSLHWNFGDGTTADDDPSPMKVYSVPGNYTVSLTASGPGGSDTVTLVDYINVQVPPPPPTADFTGSPTNGAIPLGVNFTAVTTGPITSYNWDFGDGNTSTAANPSHTYTAVGTYNVTLTVIGPGGMDTEFKGGYITTVEPPPVAAFNGSPLTGNIPLTVVFQDQSTNMVTSWLWDFGDGSFSTLPDPVKIYSNLGTYTVSLTVTGPGGMDTHVEPAYVTATTPAPVADFMATPTMGVRPLTVAFTDLTAGMVTSWSWDFGDGGTSTAQNPMYTYANAGTYDVSLTATGPGGVDSVTYTGLITVSEQPPVADFTGTPTVGNVPLAVSFTNTTTGGPVTSWLWSFGDGGTSTAMNPMYTYNTPGTYTVTLTATGPGGVDVRTRTNYISASMPPPPPVADFTGSPTTGATPLLVNFTDASTGSVSTWSWTFGDGGTSTAANPAYTYNTPGLYSVTLTVTGPGGTDMFTRSNYINVTPPAPNANFTGSPTSGPVPLMVSFSNTTTGTATSWMWTFGDGGTSTAMNPTYTYNSTGTYSVSLTAIGPGGMDTFTRSNYITVTDPPPVANFTGSPTSGFNPLTVNFTNLTTGNWTTVSWDFGDTGTSTNPNPSHTYTSAGVYTVSLTATGPGGMDTFVRNNYITVTDPVPPNANFSGHAAAVEHPLQRLAEHQLHRSFHR